MSTVEGVVVETDSDEPKTKKRKKSKKKKKKGVYIMREKKISKEEIDKKVLQAISGVIPNESDPFGMEIEAKNSVRNSNPHLSRWLEEQPFHEKVVHEDDPTLPDGTRLDSEYVFETTKKSKKKKKKKEGKNYSSSETSSAYKERKTKKKFSNLKIVQMQSSESEFSDRDNKFEKKPVNDRKKPRPDKPSDDFSSRVKRSSSREKRRSSPKKRSRSPKKVKKVWEPAVQVTKSKDKNKIQTPRRYDDKPARRSRSRDRKYSRSPPRKRDSYPKKSPPRSFRDGPKWERKRSSSPARRRSLPRKYDDRKRASPGRKNELPPPTWSRKSPPRRYNSNGRRERTPPRKRSPVRRSTERRYDRKSSEKRDFGGPNIKIMDFKSITSAKNTPEKKNPFLENCEVTVSSDEERIGDFEMKKKSGFQNFQVQMSSQEGSEKNQGDTENESASRNGGKRNFPTDLRSKIPKSNPATPKKHLQIGTFKKALDSLPDVRKASDEYIAKRTIEIQDDDTDKNGLR